MFTWYAAVTWGMTELAGADQQLIRMPASAEHGYYGLKTIALPLLLNIFFYFLLQLLCVMISHWLTVLKHKMPSQILIKNAGLVW